jgi:hypothetical protein
VDVQKAVRQKWRLLKATLNERARRLWAGAEADAIGRGGVVAVARATGMAISTVRKGRDEVREGAVPDDVVNVRRSPGKRPYDAVRRIVRSEVPVVDEKARIRSICIDSAKWIARVQATIGIEAASCDALKPP